MTKSHVKRPNPKRTPARRAARWVTEPGRFYGCQLADYYIPSRKCGRPTVGKAAGMRVCRDCARRLGIQTPHRQHLGHTDAALDRLTRAYDTHLHAGERPDLPDGARVATPTELRGLNTGTPGDNGRLSRGVS